VAGVTVSAAICTRGRPEQLRRALHSLCEQTSPPAEILVIDNAPPDGRTQRLVTAEFPSVRYIREEVPGLDFARNRALAESRQEVVAFLDDDAVADVGWVAATEGVFRESERIAICTGRVDALSLDTEGARLFEANGGFARGARRIRLPADRGRTPLIAWSIGVGSGCSLAVRRRTIREIGGFDEALDMGPALPGGGDLDILWRVLDAGWEVVYEPAVQARHEHRRDFDAAVTQIVEHNRSLIAVLTKAAASARPARRPGIMAFLLWRLAKPGVRLARRAAGRDPLPAAALLRLWWGCLRGLGTYPAARRLARVRAAGAADEGSGTGRG
jgi:GT2 family glycosyltransferase